MKKTKLSRVKDGKPLKLSNRNDAPFYKMISKKKGKATISSVRSDRTFEKPLSTVCYINTQS